jgi:hypothetical protein
MAIPFMAIQGYHTLLESRAGKFVEEPTRTDPGWRAFVEPTPIVAVVEVDRSSVTGVALFVHHPEIRSASTVVLVPGTVEIDGTVLSDMDPLAAADAVGGKVGLALSRVDVLDQAGWAELLGPDVYPMDNPDPVQTEQGGTLFEVGLVEVDGSNAAAFLGRPAPGAAPISVLPRRHMFWNALVAQPPESSSALAVDLRGIDQAAVQVIDIPVTQIQPVAIIDPVGTEALVRDVVAYPAGAVPGDRLQVRILDRTGQAGLEEVAAAVAGQGMEVIEIGNAVQFDGGETQVIAPVGLTDETGALPAIVRTLATSVGTTSVIQDNDAVDDLVVTVVIGQDFDLANLHLATFIVEDETT